MADTDRAKEDASRIASWLSQHREEFERQGVDEASLVSSVGLTEEEVRRAVDYLENHEEVMRVPQALTIPPRFVLKPGRGWPDRLRRSSGEAQSR